MKKAIIFLISLITFSCNAYAKHILPEKYYQEKWCKEQNGILERVLPDGTRVDCLTEDYAVEFDFAPKWAESIGQSLYYASKTARTPAVVLIIESGSDFKYYYKIQKLCSELGIMLWYMKKPDNPPDYKIETSAVDEIIKFILNLFNEICKIFNIKIKI